MAALQDLLKKFHYIAEHPQEQLQRYLSEDKKVVGCVPVYTPEEVIHSMGLIPFGIWGGDIEIKDAKAYFPAFICSIMQSILELGIRGTYKGISAIVVPSLCDSLKCLGQNWKYAVPQIEFIPMTYPQNRKNDFAREYTISGYQRVISDLERITGNAFGNDKLRKSIEVYNDHNQIMRQFADLAGEYSVLTASDRNAVFKSAYFMEKSEHTAMVRKLIISLSEYKKREVKKVRIVTSGILADAKEMLAIFEDNGIQIVADDVAHESRQYRVDCHDTDNGLSGLADKFALMNNCSLLYDPEKKRAGYITDLVNKYQADGVVVILTKFCDPEEFDYIVIKKACEEKNIPLLMIEVDRQMVNYEQVRTAVQTFSEMLG